MGQNTEAIFLANLYDSYTHNSVGQELHHCIARIGHVCSMFSEFSSGITGSPMVRDGWMSKLEPGFGASVLTVSLIPSQVLPYVMSLELKCLRRFLHSHLWAVFVFLSVFLSLPLSFPLCNYLGVLTGWWLQGSKASYKAAGFP